MDPRRATGNSSDQVQERGSGGESGPISQMLKLTLTTIEKRETSVSVRGCVGGKWSRDQKRRRAAGFVPGDLLSTARGNLPSLRWSLQSTVKLPAEAEPGFRGKSDGRDETRCSEPWGSTEKSKRPTSESRATHKGRGAGKRNKRNRVGAPRRLNGHVPGANTHAGCLGRESRG